VSHHVSSVKKAIIINCNQKQRDGDHHQRQMKDTLHGGNLWRDESEPTSFALDLHNKPKKKI
jgi:hypothetical protein